MMDKAALLREMKRNNCSVDELARVCGISRSAIYRRLRGEIDFKVGEIIKATGRLHPVSYTHLDVYKRQVYRSSCETSESSGRCSASSGILEKSSTEQQASIASNRLFSAVVSVFGTSLAVNLSICLLYTSRCV